MIILLGLLATCQRLIAADRNPGISLPEAKRRPGRVASTRPTTARMTEAITNSVVLDGSLNTPFSPRRAQAKKITIMTRWTRAPTKLLTPTAAAPEVVSTPHFCRNRVFRAMPPTLPGETRLTNDEANWATTVGQNGTRRGTAPMSETALAR